MSIMTVKDLKKKAPKGEFLAYINKEEAAALKRAGGSGHLVNGIPSFVGSDYSEKGNANTSGYQGGMRGKGGYQGSTGETNKTVSEGGSGSGNFTNPQAATDKTNADIKERARQKTIQDFTDRRTLKEKLTQKKKVRNLKWSTIQKQKQKKAIDKFLEEEYEISKYGNPRMIDIEEVREQLMSQYDPKTNTMKGLEGFNTGKPGMNFGKTQLGPLGLKTTNIKGEPLSTKYLDQTPSLYSRIELPGMLGKLQGKPSINNLMSGFNRINQLTEIQKDGVTQGEITDYYDKAMGRGKYDIFGGDGGDGQQPYLLPINYNTGAATTEAVEPYTNDFTYRFGDDQDVIYDNYGTQGYRTTAAEGGIMGTRARRAMGGIMNRVDKRQGYGFGSIVKSITKPFKSVAKAAGKVLKSDFGKMALLAAGAYYMPGYGIKATGGFGNMFAGAKSANGAGFFSKAASGLMGLKDSYSGMGKLGKMATMGGIGLGLSMIPGLDTAKVDQMPGGGGRGGGLKNSQGGEGQQAIRDEIYEAYESGDQDRIMQLQKFYGYKLPSLDAVQDMSLPSSLPYPNYAEGGRIGYSLGNLVGKSAGVFQPTSDSMSAGNAPSFEGGSGMGGMIADLIRKNPQMFSGAQNNSPVNQNTGMGGMFSKFFSNPRMYNQYFRDKEDFIDENFNDIDDREEVAMGGRIRRAEGGLMDLGGMEKDYRAEGGFVPIGEYEKKDDVPARLSVNEFVFTADAVRGAGQGDIDKGAEIMENVMKNLEQGGQLSEESQGMQGARDMFQTSQRLGEVI